MYIMDYHLDGAQYEVVSLDVQNLCVFVSNQGMSEVSIAQLSITFVNIQSITCIMSTKLMFRKTVIIAILTAILGI